MIKKNEMPDLTNEAIDFVNRMIQRKPSNRLGFNGVEEIKNHNWFKGVNWNKILKKEVKPAYIPSV